MLALASNAGVRTTQLRPRSNIPTVGACSGQAGGLLLLRNEKNGGHNLQGTSRAVRCESFDVDPLNMRQAQASAEPHVGPRTLGHTLTTDASYLCQGPRPGTCIFRRAIRGATCAAQHLP